MAQHHSETFGLFFVPFKLGDGELQSEMELVGRYACGGMEIHEWIRSNTPNYDDVIDELPPELRSELRKQHPQLAEYDFVAYDRAKGGLLLGVYA